MKLPESVGSFSYTCSRCKGEFDKYDGPEDPEKTKASDEAALAEALTARPYIDSFGPLMVLCDDCYKEFCEWEDKIFYAMTAIEIILKG